VECLVQPFNEIPALFSWSLAIYAALGQCQDTARYSTARVWWMCQVTPQHQLCTEMALTFDLARHARERMVAVHLQYTIMKSDQIYFSSRLVWKVML